MRRSVLGPCFRRGDGERAPASFGSFARPALSDSALRLLSAALLLAVWQAASLSGSALLPGPVLVARALIDDATQGYLLSDLGYTLARVVASFVSSRWRRARSLVSLMGRSRRIDGLFDLWLVLGLNVPALVIIYLCYLWIGLNETAAIAAVALNKVAQTAVMLREGARSVDNSLLQVGEVMRLPWDRIMLKVYLPQLYPYFMAATRTGLSLIWKIVLVVELGRPLQRRRLPPRPLFPVFRHRQHPGLFCKLHRHRAGDRRLRDPAAGAAPDAVARMSALDIAVARKTHRKGGERNRRARRSRASPCRAASSCASSVRPVAARPRCCPSSPASTARSTAASAAPRTARIGFVFQTPRLMPWLSARDNVRLALDPSPTGEGRAEELLREMNPRRAARLLSQPSLRRTAAPRGARASLRQRPRSAAARRTVHLARRADGAAIARPAAGAVDPASADRAVRHARSARGAEPRRPHPVSVGGAGPRRARSAGRAAAPASARRAGGRGGAQAFARSLSRFATRSRQTKKARRTRHERRRFRC